MPPLEDHNRDLNLEPLLEDKENQPTNVRPPQPPASRPTQPTSTTPTTPSTPSAPSAPPSPPTPPTQLPLRSPDAIDRATFNRLVGDWQGQPVEDMKRLFVKQVIIDDETTLDVPTVKVPGFIGISDSIVVTNPQGQSVNAHEDIVQFLDRDNLYICTYQWHKERYGVPIDTRQALDQELFTEGFIKNEGHHSGAIVPAQRQHNGQMMKSYATLNEPDAYHHGLYGSDGFVAVAQRLVFPSFVTPQQAKGYTDSIICWMAMINPFVQFPSNYNGGDPTRVADRPTLTELMKNALLASLGDAQALAFFANPINKCYCAEFMFVSLNTPVYPFNRQGLMLLLNDAQKVDRILAMQAQQNSRQSNVLSQKIGNPEFKALNVPMPVVPEDLPPLDVLMSQNGQTIAPDSIPFPPFKISQVIRRAFTVTLPRQQADEEMAKKVALAQARLFKFMEPALMQQLGLGELPQDDPKVVAVKQFLAIMADALDDVSGKPDEFEQIIDNLMQQADEMLVGDGDRVRFVPPRIYVDLGQRDGDDNLPKGWGFYLETIGGLVSRTAING